VISDPKKMNVNGIIRRQTETGTKVPRDSVTAQRGIGGGTGEARSSEWVGRARRGQRAQGTGGGGRTGRARGRSGSAGRRQLFEAWPREEPE
jgi:hypothetical protein